MNSNEQLAENAMKVLEQAEEAAGEYAIPVDPDLADFMCLTDCDSVYGHEEN